MVYRAPGKWRILIIFYFFKKYCGNLLEFSQQGNSNEHLHNISWQRNNRTCKGRVFDDNSGIIFSIKTYVVGTH